VSPTITAGDGQLLYNYNGFLYAVVANILYQINPTTNAVTVVGSFSGTVQNCYATHTLNNQYMFIQNGTHGYTLNSSGGYAQVTNDRVASVNIITGGSGYVSPSVTFSAPPSGVTATGTVQITGGVVTGITITNAGSGYVTAPSVTITDASGVNATASCLLNFFPTDPLASGVVFLDSTVYVATKAGRIYGSNLTDPTTWNPLNYISAESEPDKIVGIVKHLNYLLAFGQWSTEFFYDAGGNIVNGVPVGSPLAAAQSYKTEVGCANGDSIVQFDQLVAWVGTSKAVGLGVYLLDGTAPVRVSTPYIDRILGNSDMSDVKSYAFKFNGHMFYVLTLHDLNVTIVYDVNEKVWTQWTMWAIGDENSGSPGLYGEQYFRPSYYANVGLTYYLLDDDTGTIYTLSDTNYTDAGAPIYYRAVTDIIDSGTTKRKFYNRVEIVGDKTPATLKVRHTGDDYKTWSPYRSVNLIAGRAQIYQTGADRRRAWEFLSTDAVPLRLDSAEVDFSIGEMDNEGVAPTNYRR
jgi:hypothetical protein